MSSILTTVYITKTIENRLGGPDINIESSPELYGAAIREALHFINFYKPAIGTLSRSEVYTDDDTTYYIDFDTVAPNDNIQGIRSVDFVRSETVTGTVEDIRISMLRGGSALRTDFGRYIDMVDRVRALNHVFATNEDWHYDADLNRLILYAPNSNSDVYVEYYKEYATAAAIRREDDKIFLDLATAQMKIMLGRIRSKYGGSLPSAGGASLQLDGDALLDEGREDMEKLEEKLENMKLDTDIEVG